MFESPILHFVRLSSIGVLGLCLFSFSGIKIQRLAYVPDASPPAQSGTCIMGCPNGYEITDTHYDRQWEIYPLLF